MKWLTEWVNAEDANDRLTELASTNWYVSQIHPILGNETRPNQVFIAACQREPKVKKKADRRS